jgi:hypothetical protein
MNRLPDPQDELDARRADFARHRVENALLVMFCIGFIGGFVAALVVEWLT